MWCLCIILVYSFQCFQKNKVNITVHKLGNMSLSSEVMACLPSATSSELCNSKAREELSFIFLQEQTSLLVWNTAALLA